MAAPSELSIEDKKLMLDVLTTLRTYQLIGIIECRNWIELLFPEFALVRDQDADDLFAALAKINSGAGGTE